MEGQSTDKVAVRPVRFNRAGVDIRCKADRLQCNRTNCDWLERQRCPVDRWPSASNIINKHWKHCGICTARPLAAGRDWRGRRAMGNWPLAGAGLIGTDVTLSDRLTLQAVRSHAIWAHHTASCPVLHNTLTLTCPFTDLLRTNWAVTQTYEGPSTPLSKGRPAMVAQIMRGLSVVAYQYCTYWRWPHRSVWSAGKIK